MQVSRRSFLAGAAGAAASGGNIESKSAPSNISRR